MTAKALLDSVTGGAPMMRVGGAVSAPSNTVINFPTVAFDTAGGYSAGRWTVPAAYGGYYTVSIGGQQANGSVAYGVYVNASLVLRLGASDATIGDGPGTGLITVVSGDLIDFRAIGATGGTLAAGAWASIAFLRAA